MFKQQPARFGRRCARRQNVEGKKNQRHRKSSVYPAVKKDNIHGICYLQNLEGQIKGEAIFLKSGDFSSKNAAIPNFQATLGLFLPCLWPPIFCIWQQGRLRALIASPDKLTAKMEKT